MKYSIIDCNTFDIRRRKNTGNWTDHSKCDHNGEEDKEIFDICIWKWTEIATKDSAIHYILLRKFLKNPNEKNSEFKFIKQCSVVCAICDTWKVPW